MQKFGQGTDENNATYINPYRVRCMVPCPMVRDNITVSLIAKAKHTLHVSRETVSGRALTTVSSKDNITWYDRDPSQLNLTWKPELLSNNFNDRVEINLIGYKEDNQMVIIWASTILPQQAPTPWTRGGNSAQGPTASMRFDCSSVVPVGRSIGYILSVFCRVKWYVKTSMLTQYGPTWPTDMCVKRYNQDKQDICRSLQRANLF
ncbi:hypothetical protein DPMN_108003 [Dreissena polymorpha]|uniref:Uncharacterized protein n=1 Tax=Dreissena polymorpha TaxID=45954 RepID=A0A9D4K821_DREPO|nr:hypothetical protein DPMN_108003 [Dreissena polymorpha]